MEYRLECTKCGNVETDSSFRCSKCNSILEVVYLSADRSERKPKTEGSGLAKYVDFLPDGSLKMSLGEGDTTLIKVKEKEFEGIDLHLKLETSNPTKTFKDRGSAIEISKALQLGYGSVACASTGNMGLSLAHYAKRANLKCTIFISKDANKKKIAKIEKEEAAIIEVDGDFNKALESAEAYAKENRVFLCGDYHFRKEGQKTVAYEIAEQAHEMPDFLFAPVGNGTLFSGMYKGFSEFKKAHIINKMPRMIAVQSEKCKPLVSAYRSRRSIKYTKPRTEADAIAVGYPTFGFECLKAIKATEGEAMDVSEKEIEEAVRLLEKWSIFSELGGGTGFAGFIKKCGSSREELAGKSVVVVITGNNEGVFK